MFSKNLFLHDLAVVAILKDEGAYLKEWLDYHLLAGVDHFYLYDNDSSDNQAEVVVPYVEAGLVDYFSAPGKLMQYVAYNNAIKNFKFQCKYMAFIDGDEFIYPKSNCSIVEVIDEIFSSNPNAAALGINWQIFGSNGQKTADYSQGVLERFTRRAPSDFFEPRKNDFPVGNIYIKSIVNPRCVNFFYNPHFAIYFSDLKSINSSGKETLEAGNHPICADKIVLNHYYTKSLEEYENKIKRGSPCRTVNHKNMELFHLHDHNEVFDDGILNYRSSRVENFSLDKEAFRLERAIEALTKTLSDYATGAKFLLETALICLTLSSYLHEKFPTDSQHWQNYTEASLAAILKSLDKMNRIEVELFIRELPSILRMPSPLVKEIRSVSRQIITQFMDMVKMKRHWRRFIDLDYIREFLKE